jgi:hypothetical protein
MTIKKTSISASQAVRTFGDLIARCRYSNEGFIVHRFGKPVATILPADNDADLSKEPNEPLYGSSGDDDT